MCPVYSASGRLAQTYIYRSKLPSFPQGPNSHFYSTTRSATVQHLLYTGRIRNYTMGRWPQPVGTYECAWLQLFVFHCSSFFVSIAIFLTSQITFDQKIVKHPSDNNTEQEWLHISCRFKNHSHCAVAWNLSSPLYDMRYSGRVAKQLFHASERI